MDKLIDAYYKKILILTIIIGGIWLNMIDFFEKQIFSIGFFLFIVLLFLIISFIYSYGKFNKYIKILEKENNECFTSNRNN